MQETADENKKAEEIKMRQIVIETDGNTVNVKKAEVAGIIELKAILSSLLAFYDKQNINK